MGRGGRKSHAGKYEILKHTDTTRFAFFSLSFLAGSPRRQSTLPSLRVTDYESLERVVGGMHNNSGPERANCFPSIPTRADRSVRSGGGEGGILSISLEYYATEDRYRGGVLTHVHT